MQTQRTCTKCGTGKPNDGFYRRSNGQVLPECKECTKARTLRTKRERAARLRAEREAEDARLRALSLKVCTKCGAEKPHADFYADRRTGRLSSWCRPCQRAATRASNRRHGPRQPTPEWTAKLEAAKALSDAARAAPCADCGERFPPQIMHLHHRDPAQKVMGVSQMVRRRAGQPDLIRAEIAKCDVLCPNCHALRHLKEA